MRHRLTTGEWLALATFGAVGLLLLTHGGGMFSPGALSARARSSAILGGVSSHAELSRNCAACHAPAWSKETMADRCMACHAGIREQIESGTLLHGQMAAGRECRACHTEHKGAHAALTHFALFDHSRTAFPLTGRHAQADCKSCHKEEGSYKGTPQVCVSCHQSPPVPTVHKGNYGTSCAGCHTTATFKAAKFDHSRTAFPLTGAHTRTDCKSCHKTEGAYKGTSTACASCHQSPAVPTVHKANYGTACASCHGTESFKGAKFSHPGFPINHGKQRTGSTCATCHANPSNYKEYTCYNCHKHQPDKIERVHVRRRILAFDNCVKCHSRGKKRAEAPKALAPETRLARFLDRFAAEGGMLAAWQEESLAGQALLGLAEEDGRSRCAAELPVPRLAAQHAAQQPGRAQRPPEQRGQGRPGDAGQCPGSHAGAHTVEPRLRCEAVVLRPVLLMDQAEGAFLAAFQLPWRRIPPAE